MIFARKRVEGLAVEDGAQPLIDVDGVVERDPEVAIGAVEQIVEFVATFRLAAGRTGDHSPPPHVMEVPTTVGRDRSVVTHTW
jgi:hypothetical protein